MATETTPAIHSEKLRSGEWRIDGARSSVRFHTRAMFGLFPVVGRFDRFGGSLRVDDDGRASGELAIEASSINTGIRLRDRHLRSKDFFHAADHSQLAFVLDGLEPDGGSHLVTGTLRVRETSLPVRASAAVGEEGSEMTIKARFEVDHHAAGLGWAKPGIVPRSVEADIDLFLTRV